MGATEQFEDLPVVDCDSPAAHKADLSADAWVPKRRSRSHHSGLHLPHRVAHSELFDRRRLEGDFVDAPIKSISVNGEKFIVYGGPGCSLHGHYNRDDGMGTADSLAESAIKDGVKFFGITPHNHKESRNGVPPDDPRYEDQKGKPNIVDDPDAYFQLRADAERINKRHETILITGEEMGTISKTNHLMLLESPTLFIADLDGNTKEYPVRRTLGEDTATGNRAFHYKVTDGQAVVAELERLRHYKKNYMAHPASVPQEKGFPKGVSPVHYFMNCFKDQYEWAQKLGPFITGIGVIQGQGLTKGPIEHVSANTLKLDSLFGYNDTGIKLAVLYERDQHYGQAGGRPAGMGFLMRETSTEGLLEALAERRSFATTYYNDLQAVTIANDKYVMGSTINPADIDKLRFKVLIGGRIDRKATYNVKLWADTALGDTKNADVVEAKSMTGEELLNNNQEVRFDDVKFKPKNGNAFVMEIERAYKGDNGQNQVESAAVTTTIWVEPPGRQPGPMRAIRSPRLVRTTKY